jgi:iron complex transport system substrate-binding protein
VRLLGILKSKGIKVIDVKDVNNLKSAKLELLRVGAALGQTATAAIEARRFDKALLSIKPQGRNRSILYYTPSGYSAGPDTMVADMLLRLGFRLESQNKGFSYISPEVFLSLNPDAYALGFYDHTRSDRRAVGRHIAIKNKMFGKTLVAFPSRALACTGWFNAYDLKDLNPMVRA